jgi:DNA-binding MarR family transcriptional regulator
LVQALAGDKSNISHSLRTFEARGLLVIGRSLRGQAQYVRLTTGGQKWALKFTESCESGESLYEAITELLQFYRESGARSLYPQKWRFELLSIEAPWDRQG